MVEARSVNVKTTTTTTTTLLNYNYDGRMSFYTSVGCDVFLFNYRGYGRSGGKASPSGITKDVREVNKCAVPPPPPRYP